MQLRVWQEECIKSAFHSYLSGNNHFLALATPGAGKTHMSSSLAKKLIDADMIDIVICFAPSTIVANDFEEILSSKLNSRFDGLIGSNGLSTTYQNLKYIDATFWELFKRYRVLVIFDEIHHCAGSSIENANAWGEKIIEHIKEQAAYTISLTGTPWRSDRSPIVLSSYCLNTNKVVCDYSYGLKQAIEDNVCRMPEIVAIDNDNITVEDGNDSKSFSSFLDLLSQAILPYHEIIENENVILQVVKRANNKLQNIRSSNSNAGGLIVAYSVQHAEKIQKILLNKLNIKAVIVTYREGEPNKIIKKYRDNSEEWIISVGMISEGTNIPRLQVCCHLTNIKTEMHFRQILGRILRFTGTKNESAVLFMPAEPKLVEFAYRIGQDVPSEADIVKFETISSHFKATQKALTDEGEEKLSTENNAPVNSTLVIDICDNSFETSEATTKSPLTEAYEKTVNIFGRFKQESLAIDIINDLEASY